MPGFIAQRDNELQQYILNSYSLNVLVFAYIFCCNFTAFMQLNTSRWLGWLITKYEDIFPKSATGKGLRKQGVLESFFGSYMPSWFSKVRSMDQA